MARCQTGDSQESRNGRAELHEAMLEPDAQPECVEPNLDRACSSSSSAGVSDQLGPVQCPQAASFKNVQCHAYVRACTHLATWVCSIAS